jgi:hypothetical protein
MAAKSSFGRTKGTDPIDQRVKAISSPFVHLLSNFLLKAKPVILTRSLKRVNRTSTFTVNIVVKVYRFY